jgi:hypothetical protein
MEEVIGGMFDFGLFFTGTVAVFSTIGIACIGPVNLAASTS